MKHFYISIFLTIVVGGFCQNISVKRTKEHQNVTGTALHMIPPPDFERGGNFYGFQQIATQTSFVAFQVPISFTKQTAGFTKHHLADIATSIEEVHRFKVNDDSAVYVKMMQEWEGEIFRKQIYAIGNDERTVVINAATLQENEFMDEAIKKALLSAIIIDRKVVSAKELVDFTIDESGTDLEYFEPKQAGMNGLIYHNRSLAGQPLFIVGKSLMSITDDHKEYTTSSISDYGIETTKVRFVKEITIDGLKGYETIVDGTEKPDGNKVTIYRVVLFTPDNFYYAFFARSTADGFESNKKRFQQIARSFKRK